jgi:hypothetical protein
MDFYEIVQDIRNHVNNNISLYNKYDDFKTQYPKLFTMLCDPVCDQVMLNKLIKLHKQVNNGKVTQKDADVKFGTIAVEKYVKPLVNTSTQTGSTLPKNESLTHI